MLVRTRGRPGLLFCRARGGWLLGGRPPVPLAHLGNSYVASLGVPLLPRKRGRWHLRLGPGERQVFTQGLLTEVPDPQAVGAVPSEGQDSKEGSSFSHTLIYSSKAGDSPIKRRLVPVRYRGSTLARQGCQVGKALKWPGQGPGVPGDGMGAGPFAPPASEAGPTPPRPGPARPAHALLQDLAVRGLREAEVHELV